MTRCISSPDAVYSEARARARVERTSLLVNSLISILYFTLSIAVPLVSYADVSRKAAEYNEEGIRALKEKNFHLSIELFRKALDAEPGNEIIIRNLSNACNNYGLVLLKRGQPANAIDYFEDAIYYDPKNVYAYVDMGKALYDTSDLAGALGYLEKALVIGPDIEGLRAFTDKVRGEISSEEDMRKLESTHFSILSDMDIDAGDLSNIRVVLDEAYGQVGALLDYFPEERTVVILYPEDRYSAIVKDRPYWAHAVFDGKIRIPFARKAYSKEYLRKVVYHEYSHAALRYIDGKRSPIWLSEGLAGYMEGKVESRGRDFFTAFISESTFIPFSALPRRYSDIHTSADANLCYREFYLLVSFIVEKYGNMPLRDLIRAFAGGVDENTAIRTVLDMDTERFQDEWKRYVWTKLGF